MSKYIFLLKNKEVEIKSNFIKFLKNNFYDIKYLLIPISNHSFIMHKPMDYMVIYYGRLLKMIDNLRHFEMEKYESDIRDTIVKIDNRLNKR